MIDRLKNWFASLSKRERILVSIFTALLTIVIAIYGVILPLIGAYDNARTEYAAAVEDSARLSAKLDTLAESKARPHSRPAGSLHQMIAASAAEKGFTIQGNTPAGNASTTITIASANPPAFFAWVNDLERQGIRLETLAVSPTATGAISVNAQFVSAP